MPYSPSLILIWHTHTDATVYTTLNLPYSHIPLHGPFSLHQYQMHSHHYTRHLPQRSIPCAIYP
ncbi:BAL_1a_G0013490.mRNA.1.CDS.1 [Saccharomyces cerevisiae]|nr:BAL_1a_G0013490.mRNA.1.CDS.1 [Saccharomyces cerevisiae]CAI7095915.1 BAL_1a_G0013490.mRNA.1.CDS.1 [Saccharomyces cerevisiae]